MRKDFHPALETAMHHALEYLRTVDERPVGPTASLEVLRQRLCREWNRDPMPAESVVTDLVRDVEGGLNNSVNARFFAWVIGGSLPSALAADWLTSTWDPECSPVYRESGLGDHRGSGRFMAKGFISLAGFVFLCACDWLPDGPHDMSGCGTNMVAEEAQLGC
jgi:hypothetical protein